MPLPNLPFGTLISSKQLVSGNHVNGFNNLLTGTATGLTATAGGSAATSLQLNSAFNEITTVATAADGVTLPPAKSGLRIGVLNSDAADSLRVFANGTDLIKIGAAAGVAQSDQAAGVPNLYVCFKDGLWVRFASA